MSYNRAILISKSPLTCRRDQLRRRQGVRVPRRPGPESAPTEAGLPDVAGASSTRVVGGRPGLLGRRHEGDAVSGRGGQSGLVGVPGLDGLGALPRRGESEQ